MILLMLPLAGCNEKGKPWETHNQPAVSIHDPSIITVVDENGEKVYYAFGSHIAQAKSKDLISWDIPFFVEYENPENNIIYGNMQKNLAESFKWAGYDDGDHPERYAIWAPDIIWSPDYDLGGGKKGAYLLYYSASATWRRSCIGFAASKTIEGPYSYGGTVVYSGFAQTDSTDGSSRNINYVNTHLDELIKDGTISGFNEKWVKGLDGFTYNSDYAPNAIDPSLFYDEDGKLWMVYGSWSGGIFMLEMDSKTGMPIYPGEDGVTEDGRIIDRYFGVKLSGGFHRSGEGPYIVYDEATGCYYLFITYGGLDSKGGYNMRMFRSEKVTGPYLDMMGQLPVFDNGRANTGYGVKIMGNYKFDCNQTAFMSPGHNSAFIDEGQWYLVYHTRFNNNQENHEVRVHQMFMNKEGWPVTAPYTYTGGTMAEEGYKIEDIYGSYQFINHGIEYGAMIEPTLGISLKADGSIGGALAGSWTFEDGKYISLDIDGAHYSGVVLRQKDESYPEGTELITFSAIGDNNQCVWGSKVDYSDKEFVERGAKEIDLPSLTRENIQLPEKASFDVDISWQSANTEIISNSGEISGKIKENVKVIMTATFTKGSDSVSKDYSVVAAQPKKTNIITM